MAITFADIKHILELLTTNNWITRNDPQVKLEKLQRELLTITDSKVKASKELVIQNIRDNIDPNKPFKLTLSNVRISKNEAEILLSNLHLLYNKGSNFKPESQEALIRLLKDNFATINSYGISSAVKQQVYHNPLPPNSHELSNTQLFNKVLPYCQILENLFTYNQGLNPYAIAQKLSICFANIHDVENYLKTVNYASRETILLSFKYELPAHISNDVLKFFQKLNSFAPTVGRDVLKLFCRAEFVKSNAKIQSIINDPQKQRMLDNKIDIVGIRKLIQDVKTEVTKAVYFYDPTILPTQIVPYAEKLAELAMGTKLDRMAFRRAVRL